VRVTDVETIRVAYRSPRPLVSASATVDRIDCALVLVHTDEGIMGLGYAYILGGNPITPMIAVIEYLKTVVQGMDPLSTARVWEAMWQSTGFIGPRGVPCFGIAAIDTALWDIVGKYLGQPVHRLLGGYADVVPAYYSGLFLNASADQLVEEARRAVEGGWSALKMRVGAGMPLEENEERMAAVRGAVGDEVVLLADASRQFDPSGAIEIGRVLQDYGFGWFEDPVPPHDLDGHAAVAAALDIPVASGELAYSKHDFALMLDKRVADVWMPDLERVGGITEWMRVAGLAQSGGIRMASHVFQEISVHVLAALPNTMYLEYLPLWEPLFVESLEISQGRAVAPQRPGLGLTVDWDFVDDHRIA